MNNLINIKNSSISGNIIKIKKDLYVDAQYISVKLKDNDSKINYDKFIKLKNKKYFYYGNR